MVSGLSEPLSPQESFFREIILPMVVQGTCGLSAGTGRLEGRVACLLPGLPEWEVCLSESSTLFTSGELAGSVGPVLACSQNYTAFGALLVPGF